MGRRPSLRPDHGVRGLGALGLTSQRFKIVSRIVILTLIILGFLVAAKSVSGVVGWWNTRRISPPLLKHDPELENSRNKASKTFPPIIHQIWWQTPFIPQVLPKYAYWMSSWTDQNPTHVHMLWNGTKLDDFMTTVFSPRVFTAYKRLPLMVQRTDFARLALLWYFGGVWADADTECLVPIKNWGFDQMERNGIKIMFGKEWNSDPTNEYQPDVQVMSLSTWTMAAVPRHPFYKTLIMKLVDKVEQASDETLMSVDSVVTLGGPGHVTGLLLEYLGSFEGIDGNENDAVRKDVLVFEVSRFNPIGPGGHGFYSGRALVEHHFGNDKAGGWRSDNPNVHFAD